MKIAKGHCKIGILGADPELRDFYDSTSDHGDGGDGSNGETDGREPKTCAPTSLAQPTDASVRLPSGKILSPGSAPKSLP